MKLYKLSIDNLFFILDSIMIQVSRFRQNHLTPLMFQGGTDIDSLEGILQIFGNQFYICLYELANFYN